MPTAVAVVTTPMVVWGSSIPASIIVIPIVSIAKRDIITGASLTISIFFGCAVMVASAPIAMVNGLLVVIVFAFPKMVVGTSVIELVFRTVSANVRGLLR
jgi:hypothetical protein